MTRDSQRLADYLRNKLIQYALVRNQIVGEAGRNIETRHPEFDRAQPELPLAVAHQMRSAGVSALQIFDFQQISHLLN